MGNAMWKLGIVACGTVLGSLPATALLGQAALPPDSQYVTVSADGHLQQDGKRVRYWGFIGHIAGGGARVGSSDNEQTIKTKVNAFRSDIDKMVQRIDDMGFNLVRSWEGGYDKVDPVLPVMIAQQDYEAGDGSPADGLAYYFWKLDQKGIKLWMSSTNTTGNIEAEDVKILNDPATAKGWQEAMEELITRNNKKPLEIRDAMGNGMLRIIDRRWEAVQIQRLKGICDFPNKYKGGMRLGDDPQVVVWEQTNEEFAYRALYNGAWQNLPSFFKNELLDQWQAFLKAKYGDEAKLAAAWRFLLPGESLEKGSIILAPLANPVSADAAINDVNPNIVASMKVLKQQFARDDFARQRGADVVEFFTQLIIGHKQRVATALKTFGKSCKLSPCVFDSGNAFQIQTSYMQQFADAVSTCAYSQGMGHDPSDKRYPFYSALDESPRLCWDVPWLEQSSAVNKPMFVYETNVGNRTKYRAEYPYRLAALGCIQDWDIVCWHVYGQRDDFSQPFNEGLHIGHDYFEYRGDEVQISAMKAAGIIFRDMLVAPAPKPTVFVFGKRSLYDPASMDYGRSYGDLGQRFIPTAHRYGARVKIDPSKDGDEVIGPSVRPNVYESCPLKPNDQIEFDYQKAFLKFDAPAVASYTGFFGQYGQKEVKFANGVSFSDIRIDNPKNMPYPVKPEEGYVAITLTSADRLPLATSKRLVLSAMSTSFNSGYHLDLTKGSRGFHPNGPDPEGPKEFFGAWPDSQGNAPVLVARVSLKVEAKVLDGMKYTLKDFGYKTIGEGTVQNGTMVVPSDKPIFIVELTR